MGHKANRYAFYGENHSARVGHREKQSRIKFLRPVHVNGALFNHACYTILNGSDWELQKYWPYISNWKRTDGIVRRVIIDMKNRLFSDAIKQALTRFDSDFEAYNADKPDETAELWEEIAVSAGARGHQMILPPMDLAELIDAGIVDITL